VQHPEEVPQTCERARVEVGDVVCGVRAFVWPVVHHAGVAPWVLQEQRQPVVNVVGGLSVKVLHEVVDRPESQAVEPSFEKGANVGYVYHGAVSVQIAMFDQLVKVLAVRAPVHRSFVRRVIFILLCMIKNNVSCARQKHTRCFRPGGWFAARRLKSPTNTIDWWRPTGARMPP
jgi:hypothetical protein